MWAAVAAAAAALAAAPGGPRHVVVTVIDDLGFDDFGFANGGQIATPIFDGMHARGIGLTQCTHAHVRLFTLPPPTSAFSLYVG